MKTRPILFSTPMVCALLSGTKTQTRRIMKPQPFASNDYHDGHIEHAGWAAGSTGDPACARFTVGSVGGGAGLIEVRSCPYGHIEDRLWVRETWMHLFDGSIGFRADLDLFGQVPRRGDPNGPRFNTHHGEWRPSIHMRRSSSRLTLEIADLRVQRVQEISEADAEAEGIERNSHYDGSWNRDDGWVDPTSHEEDFPAETAQDAYRSLWESINGAGSWGENPWVWALTFKRVTE